MPVLSNFDCQWQMHQQDVNTLVKDLPLVDVAYYDPPYNQHPYGSNYFMLNVIASYVEPTEISQVSGIPQNWNKSAYNKQQQVKDSFSDLIRDTKAKFILVSYNNEGFLSSDELETIFSQYGKVTNFARKYNAFRGSRNLAGRAKTVNELLFIIDKRESFCG